MRKRLGGAFALVPLVLAGTAAAAGGPVTATLTPDTAGSATAINISVAGPLPSGVPSSLAFMAQPGFTSAGTKSVKALCTLTQSQTNTCPPGSLIGTGSAGTNLLGTLNFTLAVGAPSQAGDLATVYLIGKLGSTIVPLPGRLFKPSGGGLELLVTGFPPLPGVSLTSLQLQAKASQTVITFTKKKVTTGTGKKKKTKTVKVAHKTVNSILTNPTTCPTSGMWTGSITATYNGTPTTLPFASTCAAAPAKTKA